ncbi:MAG: DUF4097 family beta strand repeat-containing protein [Gemmatimonadaceae bacterium]
MARIFSHVIVPLAALAAAASGLSAQVRRGLAVDSNAVIKVWNPAGSLRLVAWDRDSLHVEAALGKGVPFFFGGGPRGVKFGIDEAMLKGEAPRIALVAYVPRASRVSAKTVDAAIDAENVAGYLTSVSGRIRATGSVRELQVESLTGDIDIDVRAPWVRLRGGEGSALLKGSIADLAASTVGGSLTATLSGVLRARLETMTGNLTARMAVNPSGNLELDSHAGTVELILDAGSRVDIDAATVAGEIRNLYDGRRAQPGRAGKGASLNFASDPAGARIVVRTYKGAIVIRRGT